MGPQGRADKRRSDEKMQYQKITSFADSVDIAFSNLSQLSNLASECEKLAALVVHFCERSDEASLRSVIDASESQALSFDALSLASSSIIRRGDYLPPELASWTAACLAGEKTRPLVAPRFKRGWPGAQAERNLIIYETVRKLEERGVSATRNDSSPKTSACDAVAAAMLLRKASPSSFKDIKKIYMQVKSKIKSGSNPHLPHTLINELIKDLRD